MRKAPAFQFYVDDFISGTTHFSAEEVGVYMRLLCWQWSRGGIELDGVFGDGNGNAIALGSHSSCIRLAMHCGCDEDVVLFVLREKFEIDDRGLWVNRRLEQVRNEQIEHANRRKAAGKRGAAARWQTQCDRNADAMAKDSSPTPTPTPKKKPPTPFDPKGASLPFASQAFADAWSGWCEHRVEIRKKLTPRSVAMSLKKLEAMGERRAIACIEHTVAMGWQGLREEDTKAASVDGSERGRAEEYKRNLKRKRAARAAREAEDARHLAEGGGTPTIAEIFKARGL